MLPDADIRHDHTALLGSLGGAAAAIPARHGDLLEIGRFGPLPCWSMGAAPSLATATARTLARRGQPALILADERAAGRRTLVVSITPVRPAVIAIGDRDALPLVRLSRVRPDGTRLGTAIAAAAALDVDAAGRRAFRAIREVIDSTIDGTDGRIRRDVRHAWALLQVTRLLFLRFVEAEGWLDGDPAFLARAVDRALAVGGDPARRLLHPLFFGTLNRPAAMRSRRALAFGRIPFLNGGLFEPHPIESAHHWHLDPDRWRAILSLTVETIEVSLDDGDAGDRVTPEMLGRVSAGAMDPSAGKADGAYYTPAPLVQALVRESYAWHLAPRLGREVDVLQRQFEDPDPELASALLAPRVIDPAVGSGALLVGALQLSRGRGAGTARRSRLLLARRLFGVDRNPAAVRIAELRCWLELLRTMRGRPVERVTPLPNLDTAIRAGDALLDPLAGAPLPRRLAQELASARRAVVSLHGRERHRAMATLRACERGAMQHALGRSEQRVHRAIGELLEPGRATTLFGEQGQLPTGSAARLAALRRAATALRRERRRLAAGDAAPVFAIESAFAPELERGGFDLVLGNPPWVRAEQLQPSERDALAARYRWWRSGGSGWRHLPDLSVAFVERAVELLAPSGTMGLLLPAKLATVGYAGACRAGMMHRTAIHVASDLSRDPRAGFQATTYPMALVASRGRPDVGSVVRTGLGGSGEVVPLETWRERGSWNLVSPCAGETARVLAARHPRLDQRFPPSLGLKTGANAVFLDPPPALAAWTRPALRGRDLVTGSPVVRHTMLWPADERGQPWPELPAAVASHLEQHRRHLERRADLKRGPWWQLFRTGPATARWRVVWSDLAREFTAIALDDPAPVPLNSCYLVTCATRQEMLLLAAWLRSTPLRALARLDAEPASGGYARFGARVIGALPLPPQALDDGVLARLAQAPHGDRAELDRRVAELLGLDSATARRLDALAQAGR